MCFSVDETDNSHKTQLSTLTHSNIPITIQNDQSDMALT